MTPDLWNLVAVVSEEGQVGRATSAGRCNRCLERWLYGLDGDMCALAVKVNPQPLSTLGEVQATLTSLRTFELRRGRRGFVLDWRDDSHIRSRPAGSGLVDVLAEHRCGVTLASGLPVLVPAAASVLTEPPF